MTKACIENICNTYLISRAYTEVKVSKVKEAQCTLQQLYNTMQIQCTSLKELEECDGSRLESFLDIIKCVQKQLVDPTPQNRSNTVGKKTHIMFLNLEDVM